MILGLLFSIFLTLINRYVIIIHQGNITFILQFLEYKKGGNWFDDLMLVTKQVVKHKGSLYGRRNYNKFIKDFILSSDYSIGDLINRQKGSLQFIQYLWQELISIDFESNKSFEVPVIFIEGRRIQWIIQM